MSNKLRKFRKMNKKNQSTWDDVIKAILFVEFWNSFCGEYTHNLDSTDNYLDKWGRKKASMLYGIMFLIADIFILIILSGQVADTENALKAWNAILFVGIIIAIGCVYFIIKGFLYKRKK